MVYLPRSMDIIDGGCDTLAGYHFYSAVPIVTTVDVVIRRRAVPDRELLVKKVPGSTVPGSRFWGTWNLRPC